LQERALGLIARHPLLGVGPQMFAVGVEEMVQSEAKAKSGWQDAHNVYLQIAAENGLGAFFLYVGSVLWCLITNYKMYRKGLANPHMKSFQDMSLCLLLLGVVYGVGVLFCNALYDPALPILLGLTAAKELAYQREKAALLAPAMSARAF
jgi:O-antigen ligase